MQHLEATYMVRQLQPVFVADSGLLVGTPLPVGAVVKGCSGGGPMPKFFLTSSHRSAQGLSTTPTAGATKVAFCVRTPTNALFSALLLVPPKPGHT